MIELVSFLGWAHVSSFPVPRDAAMSGAPDLRVFVSAQEARALAEAEPVQFVDARSPRAYREEHLPGAINLAARELNPTEDGVRTLVTAERLAERLADLGLGATPVIVYAAAGGADAAHVWWTLDAFGHRAVHLLDGGMRAWRGANLPVEDGTPAAAPEGPRFEPRLDDARRIELPELRDRLEDEDLRILDTRSWDEFTGSMVAARRGGHVPGAEHLDWEDLLDPEGRLRPRDALQRALRRYLEAPEVAVYCQSGVRAAHTCGVLRELGHAGARLYLGSWGEWGNRSDTPVVTETPEEVGS
ncbi:MAG: sulfurtransferase [Trueperaceae bacterium]|nr:sulfurtransferase [Trueperaceae bacterium]